jgi:uncharacterized protein YrrD
MLQTVNNLRKYTLHATDGLIGSVKDCYFDDEHWTVRYLVVHTGAWLMGRDVLISPIAARGVNENEKSIIVDLTKEKVEKSPGIDTAEPISRQQEREYFQYYGWPYYWGGPGVWGWGGVPAPVVPTPAPAPPRDLPHEEGHVDVRLRSALEIEGYHIQATDQEIGHVEDFILDNATWTITDLLIDTRNWWPGKKVLLPHALVRTVSWIDRTITVDCSSDQIQEAPEFDADTGLTPEYRHRVQQYYEAMLAAVAH